MTAVSGELHICEIMLGHMEGLRVMTNEAKGMKRGKVMGSQCKAKHLNFMLQGNKGEE